MKDRLGIVGRHIMEIKIGSFFLLALFILFVTLFSIREVTYFKGTYVIKAQFKFAEGLRPASPVRFAGVDVGEIKKVEVIQGGNNPVVHVYAKIKDDVHIPQNSYFFINSLSLFGEKYLEITAPPEIAGYLREGDTVEGISPVPLFNIFVTFQKTMKELQEFVQEGELKTSLGNTVKNIEEASFQLKGLLADVRDAEGTIGKLLYDDSLYTKTEEFVEDLKRHPWKLLYKPKERKKKK